MGVRPIGREPTDTIVGLLGVVYTQGFRGDSLIRKKPLAWLEDLREAYFRSE